jgi:ATP/maltotriose-dependent transcriptional regulator MalT
VITKLAPPNVEDAMQRPELYAQLDRARERPVVWVGAPAGSGKSTFIASYARARDLRCLWYSVDHRDADPAALFYYLGRAVDVHDERPQPQLPLLTTDHPSGALGFARRFFEALFQRIERGLIVLDDCQAMPAGDRWWELVREGCATVPPNINLILISRSGPPPVLARLLASSRLGVLGWEDLRLSAEETRELAHRRSDKLGLAVDDSALEQLAAEFGGWAAGVVLSLECARLDRRPPLSRLPGTSQQLFDYFASEVLSAAEPALRTALLKSAFLPTMSATTLDRLLAPESGSRLLARLKADNFFINEHAGPPVAYRYHPLFRDFLLARASEDWTADELQLVRRGAAVALAEVGEIDSALELFLETSDEESAAALVVKEAPALVQQGRTHTVRDWIRRLDPARLETDPWLAFWATMANLGSNLELAVEYGERALSAFSETEQPAAFWLAWRALAQAYHVQGHDVRCLEPLVRRALAARARGAFEAPELQASILRSVVLAIAAYAPDSAELVVLAEQALSSPHGRDPEELVLATMFHGFRGELRELSEIVERWERRVSREELGPAIRLWLLLPKVFRAMLSGEFASTQALIHEALDLIERFGLFTLNSGFVNYSAFAHAALGETSELAVCADELIDIAESGNRRDVMSSRFVTGVQAMLAGDLARARRNFADAVSIAEQAGIPVATCIHRLGLVDVLARSGELSAARRELDRVFERVDATSHILAQSARLCAAQIALLESDSKRADALLAEGLAMGVARGFVPVPVPTRTTLIEVTRHAARRGIQLAYVRELAGKFDFSLDSERRRSSRPSMRASARPDPAPAEFSRTLRDALRRLHETRQLMENRLLETSLVKERAGRQASAEQRVSAIRELLCETIHELSKTARTEAAHRALFHTYIDPAPTQLLAAEAARMSFGTYRRHLAAGLEEVAAALWLREQSRRAP